MTIILPDANPVVILRKNSRRKRVVIQNLGTNPVMIKFDAIPDIDDLDFVLAADVALADGQGGTIILEGHPGEIQAATDDPGGTTLAILEVCD